ncbi:transposase [Pararhizobium sp. A13]|uniref:transposase n=1 Tax=Pararhizobium sp. A13 TaxID=3133975 RepID=UPI00311B0C59
MPTSIFSYNDLEDLQELKRVNHSKEYETEDGINTVESFFSRIQRAYIGIHDRFSVKHFDRYAAEIAEICMIHETMGSSHLYLNLTIL